MAISYGPKVLYNDVMSANHYMFIEYTDGDPRAEFTCLHDVSEECSLVDNVPFLTLSEWLNEKHTTKVRSGYVRLENDSECGTAWSYDDAPAGPVRATTYARQLIRN